MDNTTIISRVLGDDNREDKKIYELAEEDNFEYRLIGKSTGISMNHCVALGIDNADDFWHRVYGYMIVHNNKEREKELLEENRRTNPEVESCITVRFYERFANHRCMFIPKHLDIAERPELNNFPLNILFGSYCVTDKETERQEHSLYEPDLSTFTEEGALQKMKYYNNLNPERHFWVEIVYDTSDQSYFGTKYNGDKSIGSAAGSRWEGFFTHLTLLGVASGLD